MLIINWSHVLHAHLNDATACVSQTRAFVGAIGRSLCGRRGPSVIFSIILIDVIFATLGMAFFLGQLRYRCHLDAYPPSPDISSWPVEAANGEPLGTFSGLCSPWATDANVSTDRYLMAAGSCGAGYYCRSATRVNRSNIREYSTFLSRWWYMPNITENTTIQMMDTWVYSKDLNYGITNFDDIVAAFVTVFQCSTLEGWIDIFYLLQVRYLHRYRLF